MMRIGLAYAMVGPLPESSGETGASSPGSIPSPGDASPEVIDFPPDGYRTTYSPMLTIRESLLGKRPSSEWRPLSLGGLLDEGWDEPWVAPPSGTNGGPRQGWINAADGDFYRLAFFTYGVSDIHKQKATGHLGQFTLYTPLSRRLMLLTNIPFVQTNLNLGSGLPFVGVNEPGGQRGGERRQRRGEVGAGDLSFTPRVMLIDTRDFAMVAQSSVRIPTGQTSLDGRSSLTPALQFWSNPFDRVTLRGGVGVDVALNRAVGSSHFIGQLAAGYTLTGHDVPLFGDLTPYVSAIVDTNLSDATTTIASVTPGFRTHVGRDWYFLAALEVPVAGTRSFDSTAFFWFMKAW